MLAYGPEPTLVEAVDAVLASADVVVDVVIVDNGCTSDALDLLEGRSGIVVLRPGVNTGFAGGCNAGAAHAAAPVLAFVNGDAIVTPHALAALARTVADPSVGLVSASVRLADRRDTINSAGNPVHFSGLSWAGGLGEPAVDHSRSTDVASVSGATMMVRRDLFQDLGGFCELMFAYCEDSELSLRVWQRGLRCRHVADSIVLHHYEFSRNPDKMYLLERNRLLLVLTVFDRRMLLCLLPALVALEVAMVAVALRQGWARQKVSGYWWLVMHRAEVRRRRRSVQADLVDRGALPRLLTGDFTPGAEVGLTVPSAARTVSRAYWSLARRVL
jgi:GT2 family glycosyltransferase